MLAAMIALMLPAMLAAISTRADLSSGRLGRGRVRHQHRRRHAVFDRRHFGQDRDADFGRRLAADVEADRAVQAVELRIGEIEQFQAFAPARIVHARTDGADIEGLGFERLHQGQVVELGIVGQRDDGAARIEPGFDHEVVRHRVHQLCAGEVPVGAVFLARVADDHAVIHCGGHLREEARQRPGADDEQAPARPVNGVQDFVLEAQHGARMGARQGDGAAAQVEPAFEQLSAFKALQEFAQAAVQAQGFDRQFDRAAAGQTEAVGVVGADAVADDVRARIGCDAPGAYVLDQVVLDATAGDGTDHAPIVAHGQGGADRARA